MTEQRKNLDADTVVASSRKIAENLSKLGAFRSAQTVSLYLAIGNEVDLEALSALCWAQGKQVVIPVFNTETNGYELAEWNPETLLATGKYGIREPRDPMTMPLETVDFMAVPGLAFDRHGNRLGRGGGHYDRLMAGFEGFSAGAAYGFQIVDAIPVDPHDIPLDAVVTESDFFKV